MIVVDASAIAELLLGTPAGARVGARLRSLSEGAHAPELLDLEVTSVFRRLALGGRMSPTACRQRLLALMRLPIVRHPHRPLVSRVWALRSNLTPYDGAYVALAELLTAPLVTTDQRLAGASGHHARVELV